MDQGIDLKAIDDRIQTMRKAAEELKQMADTFPALYRNSDRILSSIKMLELNICDMVRWAKSETGHTD